LILLESSVLLAQMFFKTPFCGIPWGCTHKTGNVETGIMSVRQPVIGERWLNNGGQVETLITSFRLTKKEDKHLFHECRFKLIAGVETNVVMSVKEQ